jgi:hypothetical protein
MPIVLIFGKGYNRLPKEDLPIKKKGDPKVALRRINLLSRFLLSTMMLSDQCHDTYSQTDSDSGHATINFGYRRSKCGMRGSGQHTQESNK